MLYFASFGSHIPEDIEVVERVQTRKIATGRDLKITHSDNVVALVK